METTLGDFHGLRTRIIENDHLRVEFLVDAGPRIVRLFLRGSDENWLAELANEKITTQAGDYFFRGGHRLWYAPEKIPQTYQPDNVRIAIEEMTEGVRLSQPPEPLTGIRKQIEIRLHADSAALTLIHRIENSGMQTIELAPWALTMLKLGGIAILPQTIGAVDEPGLLPNRNLILWPYTRIDDSRLELRDDFIRIHARAQLPPCKIGYLNRVGKIGYWRNGALFIKKFAVNVHKTHPDFHCNVEVYCNDKFIELETLGPVEILDEGRRIIHTESWQLHTNVDNMKRVEELMK